jgi:PAS domain-containing protein
MGPVALVPSLILSVVEERWDIVALDSIAYLTVAGVLVARNRPLKYRAWAACLMLYVLGVGLLFMLGPYGAGYIWLFGASVMAGGLIGFGAAVWALVLHAAAMLAVSGAVAAGLPDWSRSLPSALEQWLVMTANFLLINAIVSITTAIMLGGLKSALAKEQAASRDLRSSEERFRLIVENLPIVIMGEDEAGRLALCNREFENVTGHASVEVLGRMAIGDFLRSDREGGDGKDHPALPWRRPSGIGKRTCSARTAATEPYPGPTSAISSRRRG